MKNFIFSCCFLITLFFNLGIFAQSGWVRQPVNTTKTLIGMHFINDTTGWVTGDSSIILNTTNGGLSWNKNTYSGSGTLVSVYYKNQTTGLVGGYSGNYLNGFIIKTTNGGSNWNRLNFPGEPYEFFSRGGDSVWSSRHDGYVMRTVNFGINWNSVFVHEKCELYTIFFINNLTGWTGGAVYQGYAYIYKTTDGGFSWFNQFISSDRHFKSIYFINEQTGFASTLGGYIYGTSNGGIDWIIKLSNYNDILFKIKFTDFYTGYSVGSNSKIIKSVNNGINWSALFLPANIPPDITFINSFFRNNTLGWVIGDSGVILKTTNGGDPIGIKPMGNTIPDKFMLSQNYPNPFNPATLIKFEIPNSKSDTKSKTEIRIYDVIGKEVAILVNEGLQPGTYQISFDAKNLPSGVYFYRLSVNDFTEVKKMALIK